MKRSFIESRAVHHLLLIAGGMLLVTALVQLPVSLFIQYSRPSLPWFAVETVAEGIRVVPVVSRENVPHPLFEARDILTEVDGMLLDSAHLDWAAWERMVADFRIGDTVSVKLLRDGRPVSFDVVLDYSISEIKGREISLLSLVINNVSPVITLLVGYVVLLRRPQRRESVLFFGFLFCYAIYLAAAPQTAMYMPWWIALGEVREILIQLSFMLFLPMLLHFLMVFPEEWFLADRRGLRQLLVYGPYVTLTLASYILLSWMQLPIMVEYSAVASVMYAGTPLIGLLLLRATARRVRAPIHRRLLKVITVGMLLFAVSFIVLIVVNQLYLFYGILVPASTEIRLVCLLLITLALPGSFGYALLRYGFLDIQIIFKRTMLYIVLSAITVVIFVLLYTTLQALFETFTTMDVLLVSIIVTGVLGVFIAIGRERIQQILDRTMFREEWEMRELMRGLARSMLNMLEREQLLQALTRHVPEILDVDFAAVIAIDEQDGSHLLAGSTLPADVLDTLAAQPGFFARLGDGSIIDTNTLPGGGMLHGLNAVAGIAVEDGMHVMLLLGKKRSGRALSAEEFHELQSLAEHALLGWRNASLSEELREQVRMKHEVRVAKQIQKAMMPSGTPSSPVFEIAAYTLPAREVGGDFYDFLTIDDGRIGLVIGDVSDKGVSAAMIMASTISTLRFAAERFESPREILAAVNRRLYNDTFRQMFAAVCVAVLDERKMTMTFTNGGLPKPLLLRAGESFLIEWSDDGVHYPLGMVKDATYHEELLQLERGDVLVFYSDGITESTNAAGEEFGVRRLRDSVLSSPALSASAHLEHIIAELQRHRGGTELFDDLSMMVVRVR
ncbi:MAG: SpoIIE family protein phosphatase [Bacteroidetes bacterium]|nr:SpoIIE family protein phosphatase [Bacteroidota bacterium]